LENARQKGYETSVSVGSFASQGRIARYPHHSLLGLVADVVVRGRQQVDRLFKRHGPALSKAEKKKVHTGHEALPGYFYFISSTVKIIRLKRRRRRRWLLAMQTRTTMHRQQR